jgi:hypothetical protein
VAGGQDAIECSEERADFGLTPVKPFRNHQSVGRVLRPERKRLNRAVCFKLDKTEPQIVLESAGGLVAVLARLGEEFQNDGFDGPGDVLHAL